MFINLNKKFVMYRGGVSRKDRLRMWYIDVDAVSGDLYKGRCRKYFKAELSFRYFVINRTVNRGCFRQAIIC